MEPEGSLPYSPYRTPELTSSSPHNPLKFHEDPSYYYPPIYVWVSPMASFLQVSPPTPYALLSPSTRTILSKAI
jgi:hypothetical protein